MAKPDEAFLTRLLVTFKIEAREHLEAMSSILLALEDPAVERRQELIETLFREAHSLKGAARAVNMAGIESVCQALEEVLAGLKSGEIALSAQLLDSLHQVVDGLGELLDIADTAPTGLDRNRVMELVQRLKPGRRVPDMEIERDSDRQGPPPGHRQAQVAARATDRLAGRQPVVETVRIPTARLDALLRQVEELVAVKLASAHLAAELKTLSATAEAWRRQWSGINREAQALQRALEKGNGTHGAPKQGGQGAPIKRLLGAVERNETFLKTLDNRLAMLGVTARQDHRQAGAMVDQLLDDMKQALMLPFSTLSGGFPKLVRDLSQDMGKSVELVIQGADLEADRRILEELKDPLIHLLRNAIDHGMEDPAGRRQNRKPSRGTIIIAISPKDGNKMELTVADDGVGIDVARVRATAVKTGILPPEEAGKMTESEAASLIFASGFSTSPLVTDISGRGLGLAIVREKVERLGGAMAVETQPGAGTTFRMVVPLTLATFRGLLVCVEGCLLVLPVAQVERVIRADRETIKTVENRATILIGDQAVALVRLGDVLELSGKNSAEDADSMQVVVLALPAARIAFVVDEVIHEQEVLVKGLGPQLSRVRNLAGAAVLGTGSIAPVLNVADLMKSAVKIAAVRPALVRQDTEPQRKSILVAEDSITSRMLLKNILESAGHEVTTAVDGVDALTILRTRPVDLVITDVEMPGMDGFELTQKIRADRQLAELPVVLVTTLGSREHRERGIEVGANAYVVKSSFDQSDLHEIIRRFL